MVARTRYARRVATTSPKFQRGLRNVVVVSVLALAYLGVACAFGWWPYPCGIDLSL